MPMRAGMWLYIALGCLNPDLAWIRQKAESYTSVYKCYKRDGVPLRLHNAMARRPMTNPTLRSLQSLLILPYAAVAMVCLCLGGCRDEEPLSGIETSGPVGTRASWLPQPPV